MTLFKCVWTKWMVKMGLMSQRRVKVLKITASIPNLLQIYDPWYHYSSHGSVKVLQFTSLQAAKKAASMSDANRERKQEMTKKSGLNSADEYAQGFSHVFQHLVSLFLQLLVGLVDLRVHTPQALGPLSVDDAVLLFTGQRGRTNEEANANI